MLGTPALLGEPERHDYIDAPLDFGACFSYALAIDTREPLLCKGEGFGHTDVQRAGWAQAAGGRLLAVGQDASAATSRSGASGSA